MLRAILVDPYRIETDCDFFTEVVFEGGLSHAYELISTPDKVVTMVEPVPLYKNHDALVDEEGLLTNPTHFIIHKNYASPLAGKMLITGLDLSDGEWDDCTLNIDDIRPHFGFGTLEKSFHPLYGMSYAEPTVMRAN